ncbi:MAG: alanine--tRNA ligase [Candidatus Wildermuthbacteria bacterium]|nr:alanine--tRNA ligase [Candidatus Wildermuthbacteria bacterium]
MNSGELRKKFLEFFEKNGHEIIPSASLIPENDPTVLFTTAGMHPLVPFLLGEKHPSGKRLANVQACVRTDDINEVGDEVHHTFFEMLGNWSLGDYFKKEAINFSFEFLTKKEWLGLEKEKLAISVFAGDNDAPKDEKSKEIWLSLGIPEARIKDLPKQDNWWGPAGATGPCGPDTEMFYWVGREPVPKEFDPKDKRWVEIWNDVFMEYFKNKEGRYEPLSQKNVDTGMGLERISAAINGLDDNYQSDLFLPIIKKIEELSGKKYEDGKKGFRIVVDHIKAATFIIGDKNGVEPSNVGRGYVVRRLIRRAVRYGKQLGISGVFTFKLAEEVIEIYQDTYPELRRNKDFIINQLTKEEEKFEKTLDLGLKEFNKGTDPFILFTTYGFPIELTQELAKEKGREIDMEKFDDDFKKHQELSRTASSGMFKGGLADAGEIATKYHTTTHLLLAALRQILGSETYQKGSNITAERLRFDFNFSQKLTEEQIKKIEDLINQKIKEDMAVEMIEMPRAEALKIAKISFDPAKYGDIVKVYKIGDFSVELCGGPHVKSTAELGKFKIIKEEASSSGVRRIRAVLIQK